MLSIIHKKAYQGFLSLLVELEDIYQNTDKNAEIADNERIPTALNQFFQQSIIPLTDNQLEAEVASRWISLQTEIQREFRLLNSDRLFWLAARQPATKEARTRIILERIHKLISYCQILLQDER
jgi:hypothetical protein